MAQRKRFTRVEMARVLMERNQYKERFIELQEAVRWTEMIRASKNDTTLDKKSKQSIWKFFSNLFTSSDRPTRPYVSPQLRYQSNTNQVAPGVVRTALPARGGQDFLETELGQGSERVLARRAFERREQYRHVRAHVRKEDGRLQAYGWSLPSKGGSANSASGVKALTNSSHSVPVPVPVYCRPLAESQPGMKIWCAAGVNLMGGYTKDGGLMVGGSVFYSDESSVQNEVNSEVESLDKELRANREAAVLETKLSSLVWICTSTHNASIVTVIDANNPAEILNSFGVCTNHLLCIASVPGASPDDYSPNDDAYEMVERSEVAVIPENKTENVEDDAKEIIDDSTKYDSAKENEKNEIKEQQQENKPTYRVTFVEHNETVYNRKKHRSEEKSHECEQSNDNSTEGDSSPKNSPVTENSPVKSKEKNDFSKEQELREHRVMSSVLATMWLGAQNGILYVHSSVTNWNQCLHSVKLDDAVISIVHVNGRVVVALADGKVAVFRRNSEGEWDLSKYHLVQLGPPQQSVRTLCVVGDKVWCGYRNKIHVLHPRKLEVVYSFEAHPRKESQVKQLAWWGEGVWISIRLDSTLRLYHAHTYQHLQDVDIEPYVSKMLGTGKLGFSFVRITTLLISSNRLWIGTGNGVIISVPISDCASVSGSSSGAIVLRGNSIGVGSTPSVRSNALPWSYIPFCTMAHAQLSFHGHRDSVKFFVAVPGSGGMSAASTPSEAHSAALSPIGGPPKTSSVMLVMSGGEGYIDFRLDEDANEPKDVASHLLIWQLMYDIPESSTG
ncbi:C-Jun-amino-terminal kinase-interacting protein 4 isoform X2 [Agrilus planipennis]|uniref:C-Jun-amino-terminal kinase-interacting protein 4 isoform X2 n=1 Tax=Agrilus planipennis TaxID=224129 RepID=A0A1W4WJH7_AGRPL|nr:C-Jun-amino-terminal kinase-interacting protein 4 isoform X2 [Agrilus planipennis]